MPLGSAPAPRRAALSVEGWSLLGAPQAATAAAVSQERCWHAKMKFPGSVLASVFLFLAETMAALYLSSTYRSGGDSMWQSLTLLFSLLPCSLVQLTLLFVHRDFSRDRPLVLLLHLLQLGPLFRCVWDPGSQAQTSAASPTRAGPGGGRRPTRRVRWWHWGPGPSRPTWTLSHLCRPRNVTDSWESGNEAGCTEFLLGSCQ